MQSRLYRRVLTIAVLLATFAGALVVFTLRSDAQPAALLVVDAAAGSDTAPGTEAAPMRSLQLALDRIATGGRVVVRNGTYTNENFTIRDKVGSPTARTVVTAAPGHRPKLKGGFWQVVLVQRSAYVEVSGFELEGNAQFNRDFTTGVEIQDSHHVTVAGNVIHDMGGGGVNGIRADHLTISGNEIYNTSYWSPFQTSAISMWESRNLGGTNNADGFANYIVGNNVRGARTFVGLVTDSNCIILDHGRPNGYAQSTLIANNVCSNNGGRGVNVFHHDNVRIVNNTFARNVQRLDQPGAELNAVQASNVIFRNNLVNPTGASTAAIIADSTNVSTDHNLYLGLGTPATNGTGDRAAIDPLLSSRIGSTAPLTTNAAIDLGNPDGAPATDHRGKPRTGRPDIGAIEF